MNGKVGEVGMKCPKCGCWKMRTIDTRITPENYTRRRKVCRDCGERLTTYEIPEITRARLEKAERWKVSMTDKITKLASQI